MILLLFVASASVTWDTRVNNLESTCTSLKKLLQELQAHSALPASESIPAASILSLAHSIDIQVTKIENQINQMGKLATQP